MFLNVSNGLSRSRVDSRRVCMYVCKDGWMEVGMYSFPPFRLLNLSPYPLFGPHIDSMELISLLTNMHFHFQTQILSDTLSILSPLQSTYLSTKVSFETLLTLVNLVSLHQQQCLQQRALVIGYFYSSQNPTLFGKSFSIKFCLLPFQRK